LGAKVGKSFRTSKKIARCCIAVMDNLHTPHFFPTFAAFFVVFFEPSNLLKF